MKIEVLIGSIVASIVVLLVSFVLVLSTRLQCAHAPTLKALVPCKLAKTVPKKAKRDIRAPNSPTCATGNIVWILWLQGWDKAPWLVRKVAQSWQRNNPEWTVHLVSRDNLDSFVKIDYIDRVATPQAKSDVIRLSLLAAHGGVWADATMLCLMPLDPWIFDALEPTGFWMYHGRDRGRGPASWFLVSIKQSQIIQKWKAATDAYWSRGRRHAHDYFWMDILFKKLYDTDVEFASEWDRVPYLWCEDLGQAHMLANKVMGDDPDLKRILKHNPPYAVKLTHHGLDDEDPDGDRVKSANVSAAFETALTQPLAPYPLHPMSGGEFVSFANEHTVVVLADCAHCPDVFWAQEVCDRHNMFLVVYDKCGFCQNVPDSPRIHCRPLRNVGREMDTFLHFVIRHYDALPENIMFVAGNLKKHNRLERFKRLARDAHAIGCSGAVHTEKSLALDFHDDHDLVPALVRPFKAWHEAFVGEWRDDMRSACWNGIMRTTRERILRHPRSFYVNLYNQTQRGKNLEVGHYMERSMGNIF